MDVHLRSLHTRKIAFTLLKHTCKILAGGFRLDISLCLARKP